MNGRRMEPRLIASGLVVLALSLDGAGLSTVAAPPGQDGPMPLAEQRRAAQDAGFTVVPSPDAPTEGEPPPEFSDEAKKAGAAVFVRDYNLPIYPKGRVGLKELTAPAVVTAARGEAEPLSLGVHALADLKDLTVKVGPLAAADGTRLPGEAIRVRYVEAAYIRGRGSDWSGDHRPGQRLERLLRAGIVPSLQAFAGRQALPARADQPPRRDGRRGDQPGLQGGHPPAQRAGQKQAQLAGGGSSTL